MQKNFRRTLFKVKNVQMTTITKSKSVSFSFFSRPTDPVLLLIFYLQQEIKVEWPKFERSIFYECSSGDTSAGALKRPRPLKGYGYSF